MVLAVPGLRAWPPNDRLVYGVRAVLPGGKGARLARFVGRAGNSVTSAFLERRRVQIPVGVFEPSLNEAAFCLELKGD